jgi:hypothetical protein
VKLATVAAVLLLTGCGTIMHGPNETIRVDSKPDAAQASIRCAGGVEVSGTTPASLVIPRRADGCSLSVDKAGYATKTVTLERAWSGWFWTNFAIAGALPVGISVGFGTGSEEALAAGAAIGLGGAAGFLVDHFTGSKHAHEPKEIVVELTAVP